MLVGHETQPHDPPDTGRKAARLLLAWLADPTAGRPAVAWRKIPMMTQQDQYLTGPAGPMKHWFDMAREMEHGPATDSPVRFLDVSPYPTQPWLDVPEAGWSVVVHTTAEDPTAAKAAAEEMASRMANWAWAHRDEFWQSARTAPAEAAEAALAAAATGPSPATGDPGLLIMSDTGDSTYGGAPGDSTCVLRALLAAQAAAVAAGSLPEAPGLLLVPMVDAAAVEQCHAAGAGAVLNQLCLGGKIDYLSPPLELTAATVLAVEAPRPHNTRHVILPRMAVRPPAPSVRPSSSSSFVLRPPAPAAAAAAAAPPPPPRPRPPPSLYRATRLTRRALAFGTAQLLGLGPAVRVALLEAPTGGINNPALYTALGLDVGAARAVVVKTASNFQVPSPFTGPMCRSGRDFDCACAARNRPTATSAVL